jgi:FixJ family two-component response regulator
VLLAMRDETLEVPCIFWSGDATDAMASYALSSGARAFLRKPVRPDELRCEVRRVLDETWGNRG